MLRSQELLFSSLLVLRSFCSFPESSPLTYQPTSQGLSPHTFQSIPKSLDDSIIHNHEKSRLTMASYYQPIKTAHTGRVSRITHGEKDNG
jgi:hypothetical protein